MRKLFSFAVAAALALAAAVSPQFSNAANFQLSWTDTNSVAMQVTGYNLYMATGNGAFVLQTSVASTPGNTNVLSATVTNLSANLYKFGVTATNVWGESALSSTVQTPPGLPSAAGVQLWINLH